MVLTDLKVKRRSCVHDNFKPGDLNHFVKGRRIGDVRDDDHVKLIGSLVRVGFADSLGLVL